MTPPLFLLQLVVGAEKEISVSIDDLSSWKQSSVIREQEDRLYSSLDIEGHRKSNYNVNNTVLR